MEDFKAEAFGGTPNVTRQRRVLPFSDSDRMSLIADSFSGEGENVRVVTTSKKMFFNVKRRRRLKEMGAQETVRSKTGETMKIRFNRRKNGLSYHADE